jgi:predicted phage-related endonuclease
MAILGFTYDPAPQRSAEWLADKRGKIGASRLADWLAVSKAKTGAGRPLKARLDYEKELMFERQFGVSFNNFVTEAMQDGIDFEAFAAEQYEKLTGTKVEECGCWYNDFFVASPDRTVGEDGLIEIKIVRDNTFVDVLMDGVPDKHWKQIQGQLWATGRKWCDYVCVNFTTKKVAIIRVMPDKEFHEYLAEAVQEELVTEPFTLNEVHDIIGELPDWTRGELASISGAQVDRSDTNVKTEGWA